MNTYSRQRLKIRQSDANTASGDTGPPFSGEIMQMRWCPTVGDTGAGLLVSLVDRPLPPQPLSSGGYATDTGGAGFGWLFHSREDGGLGATAYTRVPSQPVADLDGFDTGAATLHRSVPIVSAGQCLRVKSVPAGNGAVNGDLLFWIKS